jgi:hypothetical protein
LLEENEDEEDEDEEDEDEEDKGEEDEELSDETEEDEEEVEAILRGGGDAGSDELPDLHGSPDVGSYVVAIYEEQWFLAEVVKDQSNVKKGYMRLAYMVIKGKNSFSPPCKPDLHITLEEDIILKDVLPEPVNSRGCLGLTKKDFDKVLSLMVVFIYSKAYYLFFFLSILISKIFNKNLISWKIKTIFFRLKITESFYCNNLVQYRYLLVPILPELCKHVNCDITCTYLYHVLLLLRRDNTLNTSFVPYRM